MQVPLRPANASGQLKIGHSGEPQNQPGDCCEKRLVIGWGSAGYGTAVPGGRLWLVFNLSRRVGPTLETATETIISECLRLSTGTHVRLKPSGLRLD